MRPQVRQISPRYSFREAVDTDAFAQFPLLSASDFEKACKERSIRLGHPVREQLQRLDRVGALSPILLDTGPRRGLSLQRGPSRPIFRDETPYEAWESLDVQDDPTDQFSWREARPFYCRWQLLYAWDAIGLGAMRVDLDSLLGPDGFVPGEQVTAWLRGQRDAWASLEAQWRGAVLLLVRIQGRFGPSIKGSLTHSRSTSVFDSSSGEMVDPYHAERSTFDGEAILEQLNLPAEDVKELHVRIARRAYHEDPLRAWYPLPRMAPFERREKLSGAALRAQDGYDAADMLRRFYYHLTGELLLEPDSNGDPNEDWKKRKFGERNWLAIRFGYQHLTGQLRSLRLWPLQVHLVVEGDSEEVAAREIFRAFLGDLELADVGVSITNLKGVGNLRRQQAVFSLARTATNWTLLICDPEGDAARDVHRLQSEGLLDPEATVFWTRSFEEDNFTDVELVEAIRGLGQAREIEVSLDVTEIRRRYDHSSQNATRRQGFATYLLAQVRDAEGHAFPIGKPELAGALTRRMLADFDELGQDEACARRPFLGHLIGVLRVT